MFWSFEQHGVPAATNLQDGSAASPIVKSGLHECCGMKPYAIALHKITPTGWKIDKRAKRKRRFCSLSACENRARLSPQYLWDKFEADGRIDGDVATYSKSYESREDQESGVIVGDGQTKSEY